MDLGFNKIAFCVLGTALLVIGVNEASHAFFHETHHEKMGYFVDVPEAPVGGEAPVEEGPRDYGLLLASADVEAGKAVAVKCLQCHSFEPGGATIQGPVLYNVVGRDIAAVSGFSYSSGAGGLADREGVWDYEHLDHFLEAPKKYAPGTAMNFVGLKKQKDRADLMAYMRTLTAGAPFPIPDPLPPQAEPVEGEVPAPVDGATPAAVDPSAPVSGEAGAPGSTTGVATTPAGAPAAPAQPAPAPAQTPAPAPQ